MHADWDFDRHLETLVQTVLDAETGPHPAWRDAPAARELATGRRRRIKRWPMRMVAIAAVLVIGGAALAGFAASRPPAPIGPVPNGWIAFTGSDDGGIYLVRDGTPARRITAIAETPTEAACPAFSSDGRRLAYGTGSGNVGGDLVEPTLVIADLSPDGHIAASSTLLLGGAGEATCPIWSRDGRTIAFGVRSGSSPRGTSLAWGIADQIWLVDVETHAIRRLTGLAASDIEWSPVADELAIASDGIELYSVSADTGTRVVAAAATSVSWSPDGQRIAYEHIGGPLNEDGELWISDADGSDPVLVADGFKVSHGIGPVWSPDGDRVAYQRICPGCREGHEVVVVHIGPSGSDPTMWAQDLVPPARTEGPTGTSEWSPFSVSWSPDGTQLLYLGFTGRDVVGVVVVPLASGTAAKLLHEGAVGVYSGTPWTTIQSWGREATH